MPGGGGEGGGKCGGGGGGGSDGGGGGTYTATSATESMRDVPACLMVTYSPTTPRQVATKGPVERVSSMGHAQRLAPVAREACEKKSPTYTKNLRAVDFRGARSMRAVGRKQTPGERAGAS